MPAGSHVLIAVRIGALALLCSTIVQTACAEDPLATPAAAPGPVEAATRQLHQLEAQYGPTSSEIIAALLRLASATISAGDPVAAEKLLQRTNELLDRYPETDRIWRLQSLVLHADSLAGQARLRESNEALYAARTLAQNTTTIGRLEQAMILDRLVANEGRRGAVGRANDYAKSALKLREKEYGSNSLEFADSLIRLANWYRLSGQFRLERETEEQALRIMESNLGPQDYRLALPLIRIATAYTAQRSKRDQAEKALQRALQLRYGSSADEALAKAESLASLADLRVVFGPADESTAFYTAAWRTIAGHGELGNGGANAYFGSVRRLFIAKPDFITDIGSIDLTFTVTAMGSLEDVRIADSDVPESTDTLSGGTAAVKAAAWQATGRSRYRPRVLDGIPVATPDSSLSLEYCIDPQGIRPNCKGKGDVSAVR